MCVCEILLVRGHALVMYKSQVPNKCMNFTFPSNPLYGKSYFHYSDACAKCVFVVGVL